MRQEEEEDNKKITRIVGAAAGFIFLSAFILIVVTLKMTPKIDEMRMFPFTTFSLLDP